jgi:hypothetical protein
MTFLNVTVDLPANALTRFQRPENATGCSHNNVLHNLADYIRSASLSGIANDTAGSAWSLLAPVWLQRQQRIRLLGKIMKEVGSPPLAFRCNLLMQIPGRKSRGLRSLRDRTRRTARS